MFKIRCRSTELGDHGHGYEVVGNAVHKCTDPKTGAIVSWLSNSTVSEIMSRIRQYVIDADEVKRVLLELSRTGEENVRRVCLDNVRSLGITYDEAFERFGRPQMLLLFQNQNNQTSKQIQAQPKAKAAPTQPPKGGKGPSKGYVPLHAYTQGGKGKVTKPQGQKRLRTEAVITATSSRATSGCSTTPTRA